MQRLVDFNESAVSFKFEEASGEVDGQHIIGKISGPFFVPDGVSRNNRKYPRELWEKVCNNPGIRSRLQERRMWGTIGHNQKLDDEALLDGKMAIVTTQLQVQNGQGMGEALILGTPAGKILNTVLRAGCKLFVSSRADGSFKGEDKGIPIVDPDTYQLEGFDIVLDPGFLQANPSLVETFNQILAEATANSDSKNNKGDTDMESKLLENIAKENATLKADIEKSTTEIEILKSAKVNLLTENAALKGKINRQTKAEESVKQFNAYVSNPQELEAFIERAEGLGKKWESLGGYAAAKLRIEMLQKQVDEFKKVGATPKEIERALDLSIKCVAEYKELGKPWELNRCLDIAEKREAQSQAREAKVRIAELAKELKVSEEKIKTVYGKISETEIKALFANSAPKSTPASTYVKKNPVPSKTESARENKLDVLRKPLGNRLMEQFGGAK